MAHPIDAMSGTSAIAKMAATFARVSRCNRGRSRQKLRSIPESGIAKPSRRFAKND
jgi:hypothetical protein